MAEAGRPHVVVVGAGFAGLYAVRGLAAAPARVTLIDRDNHHLFQPLLYQVATAALSATDIAVPIRQILRRQANVTVLLARARAVDPAGRRLLLDGGDLGYDFLLLAPGVRHSYFGRDPWARHAPGLKDLRDAQEIRRRLLCAFEQAESCTDAAARAPYLRFVIVGAGPTGVELAAAVADVAHRSLARDFRRFDPRAAAVHLLEKGERVLPSYPPELSSRAARTLERLGVRVHLGTVVLEVDEHGVTTPAGRIEARTVLWAAGVQAPPLLRSLGCKLDGAGRVEVAPDLSVPGCPGVYVLGDAAVLVQDGQPLPGLAPVAIQMGRHAAANLQRILAGRPARPFRYRDRGSLAVIGRGAAVARIGRLRAAGFPAWLLWVFVHIFWLIGFRNRVFVLFQWAWLFLTRKRGARVILSPDRAEPY